MSERNQDGVQIITNESTRITNICYNFTEMNGKQELT